MATEATRETRPSGHLQVKGSPGERAWFALWRDADGRHKNRLGRASIPKRSSAAVHATRAPMMSATAGLRL
jgi:hypothetical protein